MRGHGAAGGDGEGNSDGEAYRDLQERAAQDKFQNVEAAGAEGHADADFVGAAFDGIGGDAVETDGGENQSEKSEERSELCDHGLLGEVVVNLLGKECEVDDGEIGIHAGEGAAHLGLEARDHAARFEFDGVEIMVAIFKGEEARVVIHHALRGGQEEHRRDFVSGLAVLGVLGDADDFE